MRTTVEISDQLRLRLIEESARNGERGYSAVVNRALIEYFSHRHPGSGVTDQLDALFGSDREANAGETRTAWRTGLGGKSDERS